MLARIIFQRNLSTKPIVVTRETIQQIINPSEKYIDEFMVSYGKRPDFRRSDFKIWDQHPKSQRLFYTVKNSKKLILTYQHKYFQHLKNPSRELSFGGLLWIAPEYRGKAIFKIFQEDLFNQNILRRPFIASALPASVNFVSKMFDGKINQHFKYDVTYYKPEDLKIPTNLKVDGIRVVNFDESQSHNIVQYDQAIFPYDREKLMLANFSDPNNIVKIAYDSEGNVIGFGYLALFDSGVAIMYALYADNVNVTHAIFANILTEAPMHRIKSFEIRQPDTSIKWTEPFVVNEQKKKHMATVISTENKIDFDMKKVYINSHPSCCPI
ncbi:unnamed protein product [Caenorhabditis angaria]|uniref:DUF1248 domain-containing protein n=1 Tax=Caenorhabditis angaria TaxID=860376 RepID=A0A9P1INY4_9PELO|nr:unnamed protein product [Caenorhabditis angaria]